MHYFSLMLNCIRGLTNRFVFKRALHRFSFFQFLVWTTKRIFIKYSKLEVIKMNYRIDTEEFNQHFLEK